MIENQDTMAEALVDQRIEERLEQNPEVTVIKGEGRMLLIDWREYWRYRDLFYFLVWRDIKTRYAQSILGIGWAVIQPVCHAEIKISKKLEVQFNCAYSLGKVSSRSMLAALHLLQEAYLMSMKRSGSNCPRSV